MFGILWFAVVLFLSMLKQNYKVVMLSVSLDHGHSMTLTEVGVLRLCPTRKYHDPDVSPKPSPTC